MTTHHHHALIRRLIRELRATRGANQMLRNRLTLALTRNRELRQQ